jgi:ferredoxin-type protein NapH
MKKLWRSWRRARRRRFPGGARRLQVARRSVQALVLLSLFVIPSLSLYDNLRNQRDEVGIQRRLDTRAIAALVKDLDHPEVITQSVRGSVWTMKIKDFIVSDPLAVVDFLSASRHLIDAFLLTALVPILLTALLGRVFCGWICPADVLFEIGSKLRAFAGIETDVRFSRKLKYVVLALGALTALLFGVRTLAEVYPPRIVSGELYLFITFGAFGAGAYFLLLIVVFEVFVSKRFWCRYVCPGGALYSILGRARVVRLETRASLCVDCDKCQPVCEFGLDPARGAYGPECNNCGLCIRACAPGAIVWRVGRPGKRKAA